MHPLDDAIDYVYKVLGWVCGTIGLVLVSKFSPIDTQNMIRFFTFISFVLQLGGIVFGFCLGFQ